MDSVKTSYAPIIVMPHLPQVGRSRGYAGISIIGASPRGEDFVLRPYSIKLECDRGESFANYNVQNPTQPRPGGGGA